MSAPELREPQPHPLDAVSEAELAPLARAATLLLAGRRLANAGERPNPRRAGQGHQFLDYRNYAAGDDLRNIDWRATARSRHPQLRRFHDEESSEWSLCLDCSASMASNGGRKWALATQLTAALGYLLLHLGHRITLLGFSDRCTVLLPPGRGRHHYARLARAVRDTAPLTNGGASELLHCLPRIPPHQPLIIISDFLVEQALQPTLRQLCATGRPLQLLQISDAQEFSHPADGNAVELLDVESGARRSVMLTPGLIESAHSALLELRDSLARFCGAHAIRYTGCDVEAHWKGVIMHHLKGSQTTDG